MSYEELSNTRGSPMEHRKTMKPCQRAGSACDSSGWPIQAAPLPPKWMTLIALVFLVGGGVVAVYAWQPPSVVHASAPLYEFSAERALAHLQAIARYPHPVGSPEHARVRDYIVAQLEQLGLSPEIQAGSTTAEYPVPFGTVFHVGANVRNIVARLPGSRNENSLLLIAHYDSVPMSPGANDNGSAVAALLETARAVRASGRIFPNDIIFLFTDAEELGLLGAKTFFDHHPLSRGIGWVLNFEARGTSGPVLMFETGPNSGSLIPALARVPHVVASSVFEDVYRYLPNITDFALAKTAGLQGLNFAYIGNVAAYHNALDSIENVDLRSLQHHGEYALSLIHALGDGGFARKSETDRVFFNLGPYLVYYPAAWARPLALLAIVTWLCVLIREFRRGRVQMRLLLGAVATIVAGLLIIAATGFAAAFLAEMTHHEFRRIGHTYNSNVYFAGLSVLAVAVVATLLFSFDRHLGVRHLSAAALSVWALLGTCVTVVMPSASFLFAWPLLCGTIGLLLLPPKAATSGFSWRLLMAFTLYGAPLLIVAPMIYLMFVALTLRFSALAMFMLGLLLALLIPHLHVVTTALRWRAPAIASLASAALIAYASYAPASSLAPRQNNVIYALDADTGLAIWASSDASLDDWSRQFFPELRRGALPEFLPPWPGDFWHGPAPRVLDTAPTLKLIGQQTIDAERRVIHLYLASRRQARSLAVFVSGTPVWAYTWNGMPGENTSDVGQSADRHKDWSLWLEGTTQPTRLSLTVATHTEFTVRVMDRSDGLPGVPGLQPRSAAMIPAAALHVENWGNSTYLVRSLTVRGQ